LEISGYFSACQVDSHIRLTTLQNGEHHITIPNHDPLKNRNIIGYSPRCEQAFWEFKSRHNLAIIWQINFNLGLWHTEHYVSVCVLIRGLWHTEHYVTVCVLNLGLWHTEHDISVCVPQIEEQLIRGLWHTEHDISVCLPQTEEQQRLVKSNWLKTPASVQNRSW